LLAADEVAHHDAHVVILVGRVKYGIAADVA
jgi:hypothetical protein